MRSSLERNNKLMNIEAVASSISHELKQPLGAILLNCETAKILLQRPAPDIGQTIAVLDETIAATNRANEQLEGARHRDASGAARQGRVRDRPRQSDPA